MKIFLTIFFWWVLTISYQGRPWEYKVPKGFKTEARCKKYAKLLKLYIEEKKQPKFLDFYNRIIITCSKETISQ